MNRARASATYALVAPSHMRFSRPGAKGDAQPTRWVNAAVRVRRVRAHHPRPTPHLHSRLHSRVGCDATGVGAHFLPIFKRKRALTWWNAYIFEILSPAVAAAGASAAVGAAAAAGALAPFCPDSFSPSASLVLLLLTPSRARPAALFILAAIIIASLLVAAPNARWRCRSCASFTAQVRRAGCGAITPNLWKTHEKSRRNRWYCLYHIVCLWCRQ